VAAQASVGIGTALLKPTTAIEVGRHYVFSPLAVINDGDHTGDFEISVTFNESQQQHKPEPNWLEFSEQKFALEPGRSKLVAVTLHVPSDAQPGEYFAYIEAAARSTEAEAVTSVSAVSASKLSFEVAPASTQAAEVATDLVTEILPQQPLWPISSHSVSQENAKLYEVLGSTTLTNIISKSLIL
jgi:hypothetical protein